MARQFLIQPQSELDIQAAAVWYEDQRPGLGGKFLDELDHVFHRIVENPRQFPRLEETVHRALLRHFPYGVYFLIGDERVDVLAVLHLHRHPEMWKSRN
ncbi:MAG: type II toxin-antitoxin system RelE/ParE family toxin [Nitrospira sp.]|jgi:plasmid stabilization system protein ParE|nr:type II toxin-antitoxin system RelE/ParE family toxin [Nitrospira sp.]